MKAAYEHLRQRFSQKTVIFANFSFDGELYDYVETHDITIENPLNMMFVLKEFGHSIRSLQISDVSSDHERLPEVLALIEEHCSKTLEEFHFARISGRDVFQHATTSFDNVKIVSFSEYVVGMRNSKSGVHDTFPALRELYLYKYHLTTRGAQEIFTVNFPHLKHVYIHQYLFENGVTAELFKMNPQIRSLTLEDSYPSVLKPAADYLSKLEQLELINYNERQHAEMDSYYFGNLKIFKLSERYNERFHPYNLKIGEQLEEFEVNTWRSDAIFSFVKEHPNLKKLLVHGNGLEDNDILQLIAADLSVTELKLTCSYEVKDETIIQAINSFKRLNKVHVKVLRLDAEWNAFVEKFHTNFKNQWSIDFIRGGYYRSSDIYFTKKN